MAFRSRRARASRQQEQEEERAIAPPPKPKKRSFLNRLGRYADSVVILGIGFAGYTLLQIMAPQTELVDPPDRTPIVDVTPANIQSGPITVIGNGVVKARADISLSAQVSGQIVEVSPAFVSGGEFKLGDTLLVIDQRIYEANFAEAEANKRAAEANLVFMNKQIERLEPLHKKGFTTKEKFEQTVSQRDEAEAQIMRTEALLDQARVNLEHATVVAPFDGRVENEAIDIGAFVGVGQELGRIFATDAIEVNVPLSDKEAALLPNLWSQSGIDKSERLAAKVITNYGAGRYQWIGYVDRAQATIDPGTRTVNVVVRVDDPFQQGRPIASDSAGIALNAPPPLLVGMYATVEMEGMSLNRYVIAPREALRDDNTVWVVNGDSVLTSVPVTVVQKRGDRVSLIAPDLHDNAAIVTSALSIMTDGMQVRILNADGAPTFPSDAAEEATADGSLIQ
jgi:RND family efflux transporter MFP subunit